MGRSANASRDCSVARLTDAGVIDPTARIDVERYSTLLAIRTLARRVVYLNDELKELDATMRPLVERTAPDCSASAVGYDVAANLLIAAGDNPERLTSEAAFAHMCGVAPLEASSARPAATGSTAAAIAKPTTRSTAW